MNIESNLKWEIEKGGQAPVCIVRCNLIKNLWHFIDKQNKKRRNNSNDNTHKTNSKWVNNKKKRIKPFLATPAAASSTENISLQSETYKNDENKKSRPVSHELRFLKHQQPSPIHNANANPWYCIHGIRIWFPIWKWTVTLVRAIWSQLKLINTLAHIRIRIGHESTERWHIETYNLCIAFSSNDRLWCFYSNYYRYVYLFTSSMLLLLLSRRCDSFAVSLFVCHE